MRIPRKLFAVLTMSIMLTLSIGNNAHAEEISKEAMSSQLMQIAGIIQMQVQQLVMLAGGQQNGENQPMEQNAVNPMDIQAQQALMAQQALEAQQAMQMQQALEAQQIQQAQQAMAIQQAQQAQQLTVNPAPNSETKYILNLSTHKFHLPDCKAVNDIKPENFYPTGASYEEITANGYQPCGICYPYPY